MKKKRSAYVSAILILAGVFVLFNAFYLVTNLTNLDPVFNTPFPLSNIGDFIFTIANVIILSIYFYKLYGREKNLLKWTDIGFVYLGVQVIVMRIFYIIETEAKISVNSIVKQGLGPNTSFTSYAISLQVFVGIAMVIAIGVIWRTFRKHLRARGVKD